MHRLMASTSTEKKLQVVQHFGILLPLIKNHNVLPLIFVSGKWDVYKRVIFH